MALVAAIAKKPLVLILDAWEKSNALLSEFRILESFLSHRPDWPQVHIFCGIRQPELEFKAGDKAFRLARQLEARGSATVIYKLGRLDLADHAEVERLMAYLHDGVPATASIADQDLLQLISGFAGVIDRWVGTEQRGRLNGLADLARVASDAQKYRYCELEVLLSSLSSDLLRLAVRLAFSPRLDATTWDRFQALLLDRLPEDLWFDLVRSHVLEKPEGVSPADFPS